MPHLIPFTLRLNEFVDCNHCVWVYKQVTAKSSRLVYDSSFEEICYICLPLLMTACEIDSPGGSSSYIPCIGICITIMLITYVLPLIVTLWSTVYIVKLAWVHLYWSESKSFK
jgi:hypothetical protein